MFHYSEELPEEFRISLEKIDLFAVQYKAIGLQVDELKERLETMQANTIAPGVQFLLMYYFGMFHTPFKNNTTAGKLLLTLLNNGNSEDYRKWFSDVEIQRRDILSRNPTHIRQPLTLNNVNRVCVIIEQLKMQNEITEPFHVREILESIK